MMMMFVVVVRQQWLADWLSKTLKRPNSTSIFIISGERPMKYDGTDRWAGSGVLVE